MPSGAAAVSGPTWRCRVEWLSTPAAEEVQKASSSPSLATLCFFSRLLILRSPPRDLQAAAEEEEEQALPGEEERHGLVSRRRRKKASAACMSIMASYPLPQSGGGTPSAAGDEFLDDESVPGWSLWSFGIAADDDHRTHGGAEKHGNDKDAAGSSDEHTEGPAVPQPQQQRTQPTDDIFMSQFSDEEMKRMDDAPFEALDMFPASMHRLLSYENMLNGVLTGSSSEDQQQQDAGLGVDTMDTCGFPLFSHDLMRNAPLELVLPDLVTPKDPQDGASSVTKRSRSFEALVLQELEDEVLKLTKRTRVCYRDAFFRLAESSRAKSSAANGTPSSSSSSSSQTGVQQAAAEGNASIRVSTAGCPERETNAIDRTVADLAMKPTRPVPLEVLVSRCAADDSGAAEAQSSATTSTTWTTTA